MGELDYEELARQIAKLYAEKPELAFKLYDQLRKYFVTLEDFKQFIEQSNNQFNTLIRHMDQRFEEINQRFEEINQRFEALNERLEADRKETAQRFEEINQRFEALTTYIDRRFKELSIGYGGTFEGFNKTILRKILQERGIPVEAFNVTPIHFKDPTRSVHPDTTDVEINIFNETPPIIGEVTSSLVDLKKLKTFIRKIQFIEQKFNKQFQRFFITLYIDETIQSEAYSLFSENNIEVITLE